MCEPCSAERGRLRGEGIVLLTGAVQCALSAKGGPGDGKYRPRPAALFSLESKNRFSFRARAEKRNGS